MKKNAAKSTPLGGVFWDGGAETFIHKGVNGRWRDVLSQRNAQRTMPRRGPSLARLAWAGWPAVKRIAAAIAAGADPTKPIAAGATAAG